MQKQDMREEQGKGEVIEEKKDHEEQTRGEEQNIEETQKASC
jgi:hypothetical protein